MTTKTCPIHGTEMVKTHPADPENGPEPGDAYNELACDQCEADEYAAFLEGPCSADPSKTVGDCMECQFADAPHTAIARKEGAR